MESQFVDLLPHGERLTAWNAPRKDPAPAVVAAACKGLGTLNASSSTAAAVAELLRDPSPMVKAG